MRPHPLAVVRSLHAAADSGLSGDTTPEERIALVDVLTHEAWALTGHPLPRYARHEAPVCVRPLAAPPLPAPR